VGVRASRSSVDNIDLHTSNVVSNTEWLLHVSGLYLGALKVADREKSGSRTYCCPCSKASTMNNLYLAPSQEVVIPRFESGPRRLK
jgi:hypothetical protein